MAPVGFPSVWSAQPECRPDRRWVLSGPVRVTLKEEVSVSAGALRAFNLWHIFSANDEEEI
jgi:hypothetical protein